jgi:hypothetical protein
MAAQPAPTNVVAGNATATVTGTQRSTRPPKTQRWSNQGQEDKEIEDLQNEMKSFQQAINRLPSQGSMGGIRAAWGPLSERILTQLHLLSQRKERNNTNHDPNEAINKRLERIEKTLQTLKPKPPTYAEALRTNNAAAQATAERKKREVIMKISNPEEAHRMQKTTNEDLVAKLRSEAPKEAAQDIVGVQRLPNGRIKVQTTNSRAAKTLQTESGWMGKIAESAVITRRLYPVIIHGLNRRDLGEDTDKVKQNIMKENLRTHPSLQIMNARWLRRELPEGKAHAALVAEVTSETMANRLIKEGAVQGFAIKSCEYFEREATVTRCYRCQGFGHTQAHCRSTTHTCGHCGDQHETKECQNTTRARCANCKKAGHKPWERNCEALREEKERAKKSLASRPFYYPETLDDKQTAEYQKSGTKRPRADSPVTSRQVGRPSTLKAAATHPNQQLLTFTPSTSQEPTQTQSTQEMNTDED